MRPIFWTSAALALALATACTAGSTAGPPAGATAATPSSVPPSASEPLQAARAVLAPVGKVPLKGAVKFSDAGQENVHVEINVVGASRGRHAVTLLDSSTCPSAEAPVRGGTQLAVLDVDDTGTSWDKSTTNRVSLRRGERYVRARALAVLQGGPAGRLRDGAASR